jgi:hypothetical protein
VPASPEIIPEKAASPFTQLVSTHVFTSTATPTHISLEMYCFVDAAIYQLVFQVAS